MTDKAITSVTATRSKTSESSEWWPVVAFSLIGALVALNLVLLFPEWGALVAQYNQF